MPPLNVAARRFVALLQAMPAACLALVLVPATVLAASPAVEVTAGAQHACARVDTGRTQCWGTNVAGALGIGTFGSNSTWPVDVSGIPSGATKLSAGFYTTCAIVSGALKCWGDNGVGKLGNNASGSSPVPVDVLGMGSGVTSVSVGDAHACAVVNGAAKCWGRNEYGQLGDGTLVDRTAPVAVAGLASGVLAVAAGRDHSCAALANGTARCWGRGDLGQLGGGTFPTNYPPLPPNPPVTVTGLTGFTVVEITAGSYHTCARSSTGGAKCWGLNSDGQLGVGNRPTSAEAVPLDVVGLTSGVTSLAAGQSHTCAVAAGAAKCWGWNILGQLGNGTTTSADAPVAVSGLASGVSRIAAGLSHSCAVKTDGGVRCWGDNAEGKLGNASTDASSLTPVPAYIDAALPGPPTIVSLVPGDLQVTMTFTPSSTGALPIVAYAALCTGPGFAAFSSIITSSPHVLPLPANGVTYNCTLSATNAIGEGPASAPQTVTPVATPDTPRLTGVTPGPGSLAIAFVPPADGYLPITGYSASCTNGAETRTGTAAAGATTITVSGFVTTSPYRCTVSASNAAGTGPESVPWVPVSPDAAGLAPIVPSKDVVRFRARTVGATGDPVTVTLTNTSAATRTFQLSTSSAEFSLLGCGVTTPIAGTTSAALSLTPGSVCTVELRFTPALGGTRSGTLLLSVSGWLNARTVRLVGYGAPVSGGFDFTMRLLPSGVVSSFGANDAGQLGNGSTVNLAYPVSATGLTDVVAIAAGAYHAVALRSDGSVWTWGRNDAGQLGYASAQACKKRRSVTKFSVVDEPDPFPCTTTPQPVPGLDRVVAVSAGLTFTVALRADGSVWSWGGNRRGALGRTNGRVPYGTPGPVSGVGPDIVEIASGGLHTLARRSTATLVAWGASILGEGATANLAALPPIASIAAGFAHNLALAQDGSVWSWGWGTWGQLGNDATAGFFASRSTPLQVPGVASVTEVTAGWSTSFARRANGTVHAWGNATVGQLGLSTPAPDLCVPNESIIGGGPCAKSPLVPQGLAGVAGVYGGMGHTIGLAPNGTLVAYGANGSGQRGDTAPGFGRIDTSGSFDEGNVTRQYMCDSCGGFSGGTDPSPTSVGARSTSGAIAFEPITGFTFGGALPVGTPAPSQVVTVSNVSATQSFAINAGGATGEFTATGCGTTLAPSQSCAITVGFTPAGPGLRTGFFTITSDGTATPTVSFDLAGFGVTVPGAPTGASATPGNGRATIAFQPPANDGGSSVTSYAVTCNPGNLVGSGPASPIVVTGLANGAAHSCAVTATSAAGTGAPSAGVSVTPTDGLPKTLAVTRSGAGSGSVASSPAGIDCGGTCSAPFDPFLVVTLTATPAAGSYFAGWSGDCAGTGPCFLPMGVARNATANFTTQAGAVPRLGNISTRMQVLTGDNVLIGGFVIGGTQAKTVVVRARGPSLAPFGITNFLANPKLDLYSGQTVIASNGDWGAAPNLAALQASGFAPANAQEAAIYATLGPGGYTAVVSGEGNSNTGVGIIEVFEVDLPQVPLLNISTRGSVRTGDDVMIGGFVIQGDTPQTVVVRARGPSLVQFGIADFLANPVLQLFSGQTQIAMNDDWQTAANAAEIQSRGFAPANALESAILVTLNPGAYTAIVTGAGGATGVGIIEVFAQ